MKELLNEPNGDIHEMRPVVAVACMWDTETAARVADKLLTQRCLIYLEIASSGTSPTITSVIFPFYILSLLTKLE